MAKKNNNIDYSNVVLSVRNLREYFKVGSGRKKILVKAVDDISFDIYKREVFGLVGESGCGKTTTGRTIIKLYKPTDGIIKFEGNVVGAGYSGHIHTIKKAKEKANLDCINADSYQLKAYQLEAEANNKIAELEALKGEFVDNANYDLSVEAEPFNKYKDLVSSANKEIKVRQSDVEFEFIKEKQTLLYVQKNEAIKITKAKVATAKRRASKKIKYYKSSSTADNAVRHKIIEDLRFERAKELFNIYSDLYNEILNECVHEMSQKEEFKYQEKLLKVKYNFKEVTLRYEMVLLNFQQLDNREEKMAEYHGKIADVKAEYQQELLKLHEKQSNTPVREFDKKADDTLKAKLQDLKDREAAEKEKIRVEYENYVASVKDSLPNEEEHNAKIEKINKDVQDFVAAKDAEISRIKNELKEKLEELKKDFADNPGNYTKDEAKIAEIKAELKKTIALEKAKIWDLKRQNKFKETKEQTRIREAKIAEIKANYSKEEAIPKIKEINDAIPDRFKLMSKMQMIFQDPIASLDPRMNVREIIAEGLRIQGVHGPEVDERVYKVLEQVGLLSEHATRYPHEFSGGQRQRIGIARALVINPTFIIADEPISALDVSIQAQVINLLNKLKEELGLTILFIAHDLSVVKYFSDRIAVMYMGKIVELASSEELFKNPLHPYTKSLLSAIPQPDPISEKTRQRVLYNPRVHNYRFSKPSMVEILPNHFIYANKEELAKYKEELGIKN